MGKTTTIQVFDHMTKNLDSSRISIPLFLLVRFWILARNGIYSSILHGIRGFKWRLILITKSIHFHPSGVFLKIYCIHFCSQRTLVCKPLLLLQNWGKLACAKKVCCNLSWKRVIILVGGGLARVISLCNFRMNLHDLLRQKSFLNGRSSSWAWTHTV